MKTPRFFITLALCAVAFTIASSSLECAFRVASAQTLPVLRQGPRMGDPDLPGIGYEIPFEQSYEYSNGMTIESQVQSPKTITTHITLRMRFYHLLHLIVGRRL